MFVYYIMFSETATIYLAHNAAKTDKLLELEFPVLF